MAKTKTLFVGVYRQQKCNPTATTERTKRCNVMHKSVAFVDVHDDKNDNDVDDASNTHSCFIECLSY